MDLLPLGSNVSILYLSHPSSSYDMTLTISTATLMSMIILPAAIQSPSRAVWTSGFHLFRQTSDIKIEVSYFSI